MADIENILSAQHISSYLGLYEAARSSFFTFHLGNQSASADGYAFSKKLFTALTTYLGYPATGGKLGDTDLNESNIVDNFELNVTKAAVPHFSINPIEYQRGNETVKFAGVPKFDSGSITVDDIVGLDTKAILMAWQALAYNVKTRKGGRMKDYKADCTLVEYTQDFEKIRSWKLYGCWVSKLDESGFDRESDGKRSISATIEYDRAEMVID